MYKEACLLAWASLLANKMRSLLTMLGIIIGVASVITLVSIGLGTRQSIQNSISSLGSNLVMVFPGAPHVPGQRPLAGSLKTLKVKDYQAIQRLDSVKEASPVAGGTYLTVYKGRNWQTTVSGVNSLFQNINNWQLVAGRFITPQQVERRERVAVLGATVAKNLFEGEEPVGQYIRIKNTPFTVIGVLKGKGDSGFGNDQDDVVLVPYTTAMERLEGVDYLRMIYIQAKDGMKLSRVQTDIENLLRVQHSIKNPELDDFTVRNMDAVMASVNESTGILTIFLGSVAGISLLVGGIGIMNIMLVSVTERTREIGVRKALGATYHTIITQFIIEALVISVIGGIIGIVLGMVLSIVVSAFTPMDTVITIMPIIGSFCFSMAIGLIFGIYPARKAAKLNPIDALHYE